MEKIRELFRESNKTGGERLYSNDPFIKEFLAFCKINNLEDRAIELLRRKIREKKMGISSEPV